MNNPFRRKGPAVQVLRQLEKNDAFRRAKFDVVGRRGVRLEKIIIGIGQIHPVVHGTYGYFAARKIGACQAWIFGACEFLHRRYKVVAFGEEGYAAGGDELLTARLHPSVIRKLRHHVENKSLAEGFLLKTAQRWRRALTSGDKKTVKSTVTELNGLSLLQAVDPVVSVFPIEQRLVHGRIAESIGKLQKRIAEIESSSAYKRVLSKGGKRLNREEYAAAKKRNKLVSEYNRMLTHPDRERSILREVVEFSQHHKTTVFVLGHAHAKPMRSLAKRHLPENVLFVWITPPQLWWLRSMVQRIILFCLMIMATVIAWRNIDVILG